MDFVKETDGSAVFSKYPYLQNFILINSRYSIFYVIIADYAKPITTNELINDSNLYFDACCVYISILTENSSLL